MRKKTNVNVNDARDKIKQIFKAEMIKELQNLYISNDKNGIKAFGRFKIRNQKQTGLFTVAESHWDTSPEFITARNVYKLDGQLASIHLDIAIHTRGYKTKTNDLNHRLIQLTKLQNDLERKKQIVLTLEGLINTSKEQQRRIFEEHKKNRHRKTKNSVYDDKYIISTTDY